MTGVVEPAVEGSAEAPQGGLKGITGGAPFLPLGVLFGLNLVDEFDRVAFGIFTKEIREAFDLTDTGITALASVSAVFVLLAALPVGILADRFRRVRISVVAALMWGVASVLTGIVPAVGLLLLVRMIGGVGRIINEVVHPSLLGDLYEAKDQPRVFAFHRLANAIGGGAGLLIGVLGKALGWQASFFLLSIPTFALVLGLSKVKDPPRGRVEANPEVEERPIGFGEARRQLMQIGTLKRFFAGSVFLGFGLINLATLNSLFYEKVYGFGPAGRGLVATLFVIGSVAGLAIGSQLARRVAMGEREPGYLATIVGGAFCVFGLGIFLMAIMPVAALSLLMITFAGLGSGAYQPAYYAIVGQVAPARIRSQAYAYSILFVGFGGLLGISSARIAEDHGYRVGVAFTAVVVFLAGLIGMSAKKFLAKDLAQAAKAADDSGYMGASDALLICRGVEVAYDQVQVLFGVDLEVRPGEVVALLGTNGAGKSTLLKAISGLVDPIGGSIWFEGQDITHADAVQTAGLAIVQVPGGKAVFPTLTVAEHLRAAGWLYRDDPEYLKRANEDVLETFPRLRERIDQMAGNLSGGEQQMLALGMAFIAKPKILMIDELSLGLAPTIVEQLLVIVRRIQASGTAIILVEQSINVALTVAERAYFMEKGEVRFEGPTAELLQRDDIVRSVFLEGAGKATGGATTHGPDDAVAEHHHHVFDPATAPIILELANVTKRFGGIRAVDDCGFDLRAGEILGLIGPNGAGKTTIFDLISGFLIPNEGRITFDGHDVTSMPPDKRAWLGLGRSFQDARLVGSLTVAENLAIGLERFLVTRDHVAAALGLPEARRQEEDVAWTVEDLVELMNLGAFRDKFVRELSTGSRRIVDLAMCIAHDPKVLLLDEPSSGIAQREAEAMGPLLRRIQSETGCALLVIEHDMPLITGVSDRMIALELGHPIVEGTPEEVTTNPRVVSSYLGGDMAVINRSGVDTNIAGVATEETPVAPAAPVRRRRTQPLTASGANGRPRPAANGNGQKPAGSRAAAGNGARRAGDGTRQPRDPSAPPRPANGARAPRPAASRPAPDRAKTTPPPRRRP